MKISSMDIESLCISLLLEYMKTKLLMQMLMHSIPSILIFVLIKPTSELQSNI